MGGSITDKNLDVRTLLLCKVYPHAVRDGRADYNTSYKNMYAGPGNPRGRRFVTFGHFDAMSIYQIKGDKEWLNNVYKDNTTISSVSVNNVSYLPIHLVSYHKDNKQDFWEDVEKNYRFCVATLCYGVHSQTTKDNEDSVQKYIESHSIDPQKVKIATYRATSICDVVVLWYTNDINYVLKQISRLNQEKCALKTYSIVGFPMDDQGELLNLDAILDTEEFHVRITGSIRDYEQAYPLLLNPNDGLQKSIGVTPLLERTVFGKEDFCLLLPGLSGASLKKMINWFSVVTNSNKISNACWEIHTEFLLKKEDSPCSTNEQTNKHIIKPLHDAFIDIYKNRYKKDLDKCPWVHPFLELLGIHAYIDRNPILRSPSYLFFDFLSVVKYYFENPTNPIISNSIEKIQNVIRHWNNITEKVTRIEELIFKGLGSSTVIFSTTPFCVLDFYQSFLRKIIEMLIEIDDKDNRKPKSSCAHDDYEYAFLLLPEYNQRPRISSIFKEDLTVDVCQNGAVAKCDDCIFQKDCARRRLSPLKQAYLVEFPIDLLYKPMDFMFPMVHECSHIFGDALRKRDVRKGQMICIIANEVLRKLGLQPQNSFLNFHLFLCYKLRIQKGRELLSMQLKVELLRNLEAFFSADLSDIEKELLAFLKVAKPEDAPFDIYYVKTTEILQKWHDNQSLTSSELIKPWGTKIDYWAKYFKECYADLIAMLLLKLSTKDYLRMFEHEAETFDRPDVVSVATKGVTGTRIGLVLAALGSNNNGADGRNRIISAVMKSNLPDAIKWHAKNTVLTILDDTYVLSGAERQRAGGAYLEDPYSLNCVCNYLKAVIKCFCDKTSNSASIEEIRNDYNDLIVNGQMFNDRFFEIIDKCHNRINDIVDRLEQNDPQN